MLINKLIKPTFILFCLLGFIRFSFGQGMILDDGTDSLMFFNKGVKSMVLTEDGKLRLGEIKDPDISAILQLNSTSGGLLIPRVTTAQRNAFSNNVSGNLIYNTSSGIFQIYGGAAWDNIITTSTLADPPTLTDSDGDTRIEVEQNTDEDKIRFTTRGTQRAMINENGYIGVGTSLPSVPLHVSVTGGDQIRMNGTTGSNVILVLSPNGSVFNAARIGGIEPGSGNTEINFLTSGLERVRIADDGNIGIGITTPDEKLHVVGSIKMVDGNQTSGRVMTTDATGVGSWQDIPLRSEWIKIEETILTMVGAYTFNGLNGNLHKMYKVVFHGTINANGVDNRIFIRPNGSSSNYRSVIGIAGDAGFGEWDFTAFYAGRSAYSLDAEVAVEFVFAAETGMNRVGHGSGTYYDEAGNRMLTTNSMGGVWRNTTSNITSIEVSTSASGTFSGKVSLYYKN